MLLGLGIVYYTATIARIAFLIPSSRATFQTSRIQGEKVLVRIQVHLITRP